MNGYLLDTNIALLAVIRPERVARRIQTAIRRGPLFLSILSYWEVMIKSCKGNLNVGDPRRWWEETQRILKAEPLFVEAAHIAALYDLPPHHHDPFDRALLAQASVEGLAFLTTDDRLDAYAGGCLRVLR